MNQLAFPFVGAIVEREIDGEIEVLMSIRNNPKTPHYTGTLEFPAGTLDRGYENIYDVLAREILEETGLELEEVIDKDKTDIHSPRDDGSFGFRPFCCIQQLKNGYPWVGFIFRCRVKDGIPKHQESENKDVRWMKVSEIKKIYENTPEKLFTLELPAWDYYFRCN